MIYKIYEEFLPEVEKKIKRIAKKCARNGNTFKYAIVGEELKPVEDDFGKVRYYNMILVEVEGAARIDDWEFVATCEIHECGNIIRRYNTDIEIPVRFRTSKNICDHCQQKRGRNNLYIIHNVETDDWKQVGKNCLALYTGGLNAEYVTAWMDGIIELETNNGRINGAGKPRYDIKEVLKYAVEIIDKIGYFNSDSRIPTKSLVATMLCEKSVRDGIKTIEKFYDISFENEDFNKADTSEKVDKIIAYWKDVNDSSEFAHNIKTMIEEGIIIGRNIGFVSYMPEGYYRYLKHEARKKVEREEEVEGHFWEVGKRVKNADVKYINVLARYQTEYGVNQFCKIVLSDGKVVYWSGKGIEEYTYKGNKEIELIPEKISFTVKEHGEYRGTNQTKVTRCKIIYKEGSAA